MPGRVGNTSLVRGRQSHPERPEPRGTRNRTRLCATGVALLVVLNSCKGVDAQKGATSQSAAAAQTDTLWKRDSTVAKDSAAKADAERIALDAYVYGYPLVTMDRMRRVMTNVSSAGETRAPVGQFANMPSYPDPSFKDWPTPSPSTLYSIAWLDLERQPYVLSLPDEHGRYYVMPMLGGWMNVFESPSARTAGKGTQLFLIAGPGWKGSQDTLGATFIRAPTNLVAILGRTFAKATPTDMREARALQRQYTLVPLGAYGRPSARVDPSRVDPSIDMKTPIRAQVNALDAPAFFNQLAMLMKANPPASTDSVIVAQMASIGIVAGQPFDPTKLGNHASEILSIVPRLGQQRIMAVETNLPIVHGWTSSNNLGAYTDHLDFRAYAAIVGFDGSLPKDVVHDIAGTDVAQHPLDGTRRYVMHFAKGEEPPAKAYWSITMYDSAHALVPNAIHRYAISPKQTPVTHNADGSLDIFFQHEPIAGPMQSNWLPTPAGRFYLVLRIHSPTDSVLAGTWSPPGVVEVGTRVWER
ncbi:MAG TPA: DUF1254 domain-containing protein [Gemmatimonadaceae bacterium]|nr:DUF1254 domain-containing protein [Gemmatimonadaceae bacterium]